ncbi:MAG: zonular occludens toxin domain-containing protein [Candidatus Woesearchaeota archaeon]|nr:zonular occludens toxin domain-containing protein [Candidatus Woesearchaeota archaeon]
MKKKSLARRAFIGTAKGLWWIAKGSAKLAWKGAKAGISTTSAIAKKAEEKRNQPQQPAQAIQLTIEKTVKGEFNSFEQRLQKDSLIILIAGRRGSGKSVTGFRILENIHAQTKRPCCAMGPAQAVLPAWIRAVQTVQEAPNHSTILVDEGAIAFNSRNSMSTNNKQLGELLAIARHKDITLILITQNTGMIDKNILSLCDTIIFKEGSLLQERMERTAIKDLYETANKELAKIPQESRNKHCYIIDSGFEGLCSAELPSFWSSSVSKNRAN